LATISSHLDFIRDNDEHADIASGDRDIDDSMLDPDPEQDGTDSADANASAAAAEDKAGEPKPTSSTARFLANIKANLMDEIEKYGQPLCYKNNDFVIRAPHPCFALRRTQAMGFSPEKLYHRNVFVWLPDLLVPQRKFYCKCGEVLSKNGTPFCPL
jgi:hypothetical protein